MVVVAALKLETQQVEPEPGLLGRAITVEQVYLKTQIDQQVAAAVLAGLALLVLDQMAVMAALQLHLQSPGLLPITLVEAVVELLAGLLV